MQNKKELIDAYKNRKQIGGICKITNTKINKIFLFTTADIVGSENRFEFSKKTGSAINLKLQSDCNKYGLDAFVFEVVEELEKNVDQTVKEFNEDLNELLEIYVQKFSNVDMY